MDRLDKIMGVIKHEAYKPLNMNELAFLMQVPQSDMDIFESSVLELVEEGKLFFTKKRKLVLPQVLDYITGVYIGNQKGFGFFTPDEGEYETNKALRNMQRGDFFVPPGSSNGAIHGDRVYVRLLQYERRPECEVCGIIARDKKVVVGTFSRLNRGEGLCYPDNPKLPKVIIPSGKTMSAVSGHKVVVKLIDKKMKSNKDETLSGEVIKIIGHENDPGADIMSLVYESGVPFEFPAEVMEECDKIPMEVNANDMEFRRDIRNEYMVTIDSPDAKDLDDAVSLRMLPGGNFLLGVHIADVSEYVIENSALDKEAVKRGTSIYLANGAVPMLPHKLSNGICSLNPGEDRLCLSCEMEIDRAGDVISHEIFMSIIKTNERMNYEDVAEMISDANSPLRSRYRDGVNMFDNMLILSKILKEKRIKRGAIEFFFPECKIKLDENGRACGIIPYLRNDATDLIEEFMLIANETVAEKYFWLNLPFVYRTHEPPDEEKLQNLSAFVAELGYHIKGKNHPKSLQALLLSVAEDSPVSAVISRAVLRSFKQARYTPESLGHFGLAAKFYCHFTSPIRRYPDLQIHRIIKYQLTGRLTDKKIDHFKKILPEISLRCSKYERRAEELERDVTNMKKVEFMEDKVGGEFDGIISGITGRGIYVELPNTVEGMVSIDTLTDDNYIFDEKKLILKGVHKSKAFCIGDSVRIEVISANKQLRRLDFELV